jgi:Reverse transcriptase (RNA-dependent DNA polymerase)
MFLANKEKLPARLRALTNTHALIKTEKVCRLNRALYGLPESAHLWNETFTEKIAKLGFKALLEGPCTYTKKDGHSILIIYADDAISAARTDSLRISSLPIRGGMSRVGPGDDKIAAVSF